MERENDVKSKEFCPLCMFVLLKFMNSVRVRMVKEYDLRSSGLKARASSNLVVHISFASFFAFLMKILLTYVYHLTSSLKSSI